MTTIGVRMFNILVIGLLRLNLLKYYLIFSN
nr:MAG TPA: hypothetical protein [Caudoviricetes sp.]